MDQISEWIDNGWVHDRAEALLVAHQRQAPGGCRCGWNALGESFARHQAEKLRAAGLLKEESA